MKYAILFLLSLSALADPSPTPSPSPAPKPPMIPSQYPISIMQHGVSHVYNKWIVSNATIRFEPTGEVSLYVQFLLSDSSGVAAPVPPKNFMVKNILTDANLAAGTQAFFAGLVGEAMQSGVIQ